MPGPLRHIAVTVEEAAPDAFVWRLLEQSGAEWGSLDAAKRPSKSYAAAMSAGLLALQELVDDLDAGPRHESSSAQPSQPHSPSARPFGFGTLK